VGRACERERARASVAQLWGLMFAQLCRLVSAAANQRCATMRTVPIVAGVHTDRCSEGEGKSKDARESWFVNVTSVTRRGEYFVLKVGQEAT
jgi:hypothetical protein